MKDKKSSSGQIDSHNSILDNPQLIKAILNQAMGSYVLIDKKLTILEINPRFCAKLGYDCNELIGKNIDILERPIEERKNIRLLTSKLKETEILIYETRQINKRGKEDPVEITLTPIKTDTEVYTLATFRDISLQKKRENELATTKKFLEAAFDQSPIGMAMVDLPLGHVLFFNRACKEILGYPEDQDYFGRPISELEIPWESYNIAGKKTPLNEAPLFKAMQGQQVSRKYYLLKRKDQTERHILSDALPVKDETGKAIAALVFLMDITDLKQVESALIENEERYRRITENSEDFVYRMTLPEGRYEYISTTVEKVFGYTQKEFYENPILIQKIIHPDWVEYFRIEWANLLEGKMPPTYEYQIIDNEGKTRWISQKNHLVTDNNGNPTAIEGIVSDITEQKQYQQELERINLELESAKKKAEESDRLKTAFLANMSHEIRTPMNGIIGFADLLTEENLETAEVREFAQTIRKSSQQLLKIVNDIVDIAKIEAGQMNFSIGPCRILEIVEDIEGFFRPMIEGKGLKFHIETDLDKNDDLLYSDELKIRQIITNLLNNALRFTPSGSITVKTTKVEGMAVFKVSDTGIGIPEGLNDVIFKRFVQVDTDQREAFGGTGLGLPISKALAELLSGTITVESQVNHGSSFSLILPLNIPAEQQNGTKVNGRKTILIVEDQAINFLYLKEILKSLGFSILRAGTGEAALEICRQNHNISIILMDIRLPGIDGLETTRRLRKEGCTMPIIAQTAYALKGDREKALEAGCNDYLSKPILRNPLEEVLNQFLPKYDREIEST